MQRSVRQRRSPRRSSSPERTSQPPWRPPIDELYVTAQAHLRAIRLGWDYTWKPVAPQADTRYRPQRCAPASLPKADDAAHKPDTHPRAPRSFATLWVAPNGHISLAQKPNDGRGPRRKVSGLQLLTLLHSLHAYGLLLYRGTLEGDTDLDTLMSGSGHVCVNWERLRALEERWMHTYGVAFQLSTFFSTLNYSTCEQEAALRPTFFGDACGERAQMKLLAQRSRGIRHTENVLLYSLLATALANGDQADSWVVNGSARKYALQAALAPPVQGARFTLVQNYADVYVGLVKACWEDAGQLLDGPFWMPREPQPCDANDRAYTLTDAAQWCSVHTCGQRGCLVHLGRATYADNNAFTNLHRQVDALLTVRPAAAGEAASAVLLA